MELTGFSGRLTLTLTLTLWGITSDQTHPNSWLDAGRWSEVIETEESKRGSFREQQLRQQKSASQQSDFNCFLYWEPEDVQMKLAKLNWTYLHSFRWEIQIPVVALWRRHLLNQIVPPPGRKKPGKVPVLWSGLWSCHRYWWSPSSFLPPSGALQTDEMQFQLCQLSQSWLTLSLGC